MARERNINGAAARKAAVTTFINYSVASHNQNLFTAEDAEVTKVVDVY